ncbi:MAG: hypothetical protein L0Z55_05260 [Planctomycetes bacterium]|nr:hypothetical protein [Planctomycetota bacterium]
MSGSFTEFVAEDSALAWLEALDSAVPYGPDFAVGEPGAVRSDPNYRDVLMSRWPRDAQGRLARVAALSRVVSRGVRARRAG